jgi:hypothetical protein
MPDAVLVWGGVDGAVIEGVAEGAAVLAVMGPVVGGREFSGGVWM